MRTTACYKCWAQASGEKVDEAVIKDEKLVQQLGDPAIITASQPTVAAPHLVVEAMPTTSVAAMNYAYAQPIAPAGSYNAQVSPYNPQVGAYNAQIGPYNPQVGVYNAHVAAAPTGGIPAGVGGTQAVGQQTVWY